MKKLLIGLIVVATACSLNSCSSGKGCKGGGWYGNRNLSSVPSQENLDAMICKDETEATMADYEPAMP